LSGFSECFYGLCFSGFDIGSVSIVADSVCAAA
jgi:hypothetical protein